MPSSRAHPSHHPSRGRVPRMHSTVRRACVRSKREEKEIQNDESRLVIHRYTPRFAHAM